ncbi:hypothetical protein O3P69_020768 [Scylla paramamosain]|uniref:Uncharacterized protein n=1 Tax=Scylla paramamosain TaxID=85552 RepID=A0AAW0TNJ8_SCYPA
MISRPRKLATHGEAIYLEFILGVSRRPGVLRVSLPSPAPRGELQHTECFHARDEQPQRRRGDWMAFGIAQWGGDFSSPSRHGVIHRLLASLQSLPQPPLLLILVLPQQWYPSLCVSRVGRVGGVTGSATPLICTSAQVPPAEKRERGRDCFGGVSDVNRTPYSALVSCASWIVLLLSHTVQH